MKIDDFVGREAEARTILANTDKAHNTLVVGGSGIGKSALLEFLSPVIEERAVALHITRHAPFGMYLKEIYTGLWDARLIGKTHEASYDGSPDLQMDIKDWGKQHPTNQEKAKHLVHELKRVAENKPVVMLVDDASGITPTSRPWLEQVSEVAVMVAAVDPKALKNHKRFWRRFDEVKLEPLNRADSTALATKLIERYNVTADDPEVYKRRLIELSGGSPFELERLVKYHSADAVVRTRDMGHASQNFVERDEKGVAIAPVLLLFAAWGIALRYIARAQGDLDLYVIGGISIAVMIVFSPFLRSALKPRSSN